MMVVSIDYADVYARAVPALLAMPQIELLTVKPIFLCKWRGRRQDPPMRTADLHAWSRITLCSDGDSLLGSRPEHPEIIQRLRMLGAAGATVLRGTSGYALGDPTRPGRPWSRHRSTPSVTIVVDASDHAAQWLRAIDQITGDHGLITHEFISAYRLT